jgi:hypothetical protein
MMRRSDVGTTMSTPMLRQNEEVRGRIVLPEGEILVTMHYQDRGPNRIHVYVKQGMGPGHKWYEYYHEWAI